MKKKLLIGVLVIGFCFSCISCGSNTEKENNANVTQKESEQPESDSQESVTQEAESNTSAKVDEIMLQAKNDAEHISEDEATEKWNEAFKYLKEHQSNFYENNEVMEQSMYYGTFIYEYIELNAKATNVSELPDATRTAYEAGLSTVEAIKYVYRGAASVDDEDTQSKLKEATDNLDLMKIE